MQSGNQNLEIQFKGRSIFSLLIVIALILGIFVGFIGTKVFDKAVDVVSSEDENSENVSTEFFNSNGALDDEYLNGVLEVFKEKYITEFSDFDEDDLTYGAIKGIIESLDDKYTTFLSPEEAESYLNRRGSDFEGIGVTLEFANNYTYVESVLKGYPAEKADIRNGDVIVEIDGESAESLTPSEVAEKIRGQAGTTVKLKIFREVDGNAEELEKEVRREKIEIDNVTWKKVGDKVQINITQFNDESIDEFNNSWDKVVEEIKNEMGNPDGIIVDLRNNPGGYVKSVQYVLEEFLKDDQILMKEKDRKNPATVYKDNREGEFEDIPLVVLVNEGSASASEIFATAIQDNDRGEVVGMKTVGKGVEQELIQLKDGSILLIVFQKWLTPDDREINEENPVTPDYEIDYTEEDFRNNEDPQLDKALELLSK